MIDPKDKEHSLSAGPWRIDDKNSVAVAAFNLKLLQDGAHIACFILTPQLASDIGMVIAHWGMFESLFNKLIDSLLTATKREEINWRNRPFEKRVKLFMDLLEPKIKPRHPKAVQKVDDILRHSVGLCWKRNLVAHGDYTVTFPPAGSDSPTFKAEGKRGGRSQTISIDHDTLEALWHEIAHATGALIESIRPFGKHKGWPYTLPDRWILQVAQQSRNLDHPPK